MQPIVLAANGADAAAVDAISQQHSELASTLAVKSIHLIDAVTAGAASAGAVPGASAIDAARADLAGWCRSALLPLLRREADVLFPAAPATAESAALVADLRRSLSELEAAVDVLQNADAGTGLSAAVVTLRNLLDRHLAAENDSLLPYLAFSRQATLAELWRRIRETPRPSAPSDAGGPAAVAADRDAHQDDAHAATCQCADEDEELPALDVRAVPHAIRHATVFGALDAIGPGGGMILIAPHDPLPLLAQIEQRMPGRFTVSYLKREPGECRLQFLREHS